MKRDSSKQAKLSVFKTVFFPFSPVVMKMYGNDRKIEQIIEFELPGPGAPGRTCTPKTGYYQVQPSENCNSESFRAK